MRSAPARVRFLATCGIVILSLALLPAVPTAAERLAAFLTVDADQPSALPHPTAVPHRP